MNQTQEQIVQWFDAHYVSMDMNNKTTKKAIYHIQFCTLRVYGGTLNLFTFKTHHLTFSVAYIIWVPSDTSRVQTEKDSGK